MARGAVSAAGGPRAAEPSGFEDGSRALKLRGRQREACREREREEKKEKIGRGRGKETGAKKKGRREIKIQKIKERWGNSMHNRAQTAGKKTSFTMN